MKVNKYKAFVESLTNELPANLESIFSSLMEHGDKQLNHFIDEYKETEEATERKEIAEDILLFASDYISDKEYKQLSQLLNTKNNI
jgi:succinate dehydrogenase flavin-adding protein (antitoxin of CptAB toxin-antitoxin module)